MDVIDLLVKQFGCERREVEKLGLRFVIGGKGRIFASRECEIDVRNLRKGLYFGAVDGKGIRLSIEGSFIIGKLARRKVVEVDETKAIRWLRGEDIEVDIEEGSAGEYWIVKWGEYYLGSGLMVIRDGKRFVRNFVPKDRRLSRVGEDGEDTRREVREFKS